MDTNVYHWYHGKLNVGHQTCRHPRPLGEFGKHRTCDFKLQSKMAGQSQEQKGWILEDLTINQSII